jgi:hypothetical protein
MMKHLSTPISFPESSPSVFGREILKNKWICFWNMQIQFRFSDKRAADIQMWSYLNCRVKKSIIHQQKSGEWTTCRIGRTSSVCALGTGSQVERGKGMTSSREYVHTRMNVHGRRRGNKEKHKGDRRCTWQSANAPLKNSNKILSNWQVDKWLIKEYFTPNKEKFTW